MKTFDITLDEYQMSVLVQAIGEAIDQYSDKKDKGENIPEEFIFELMNMDTFFRVKLKKAAS